MRTLPRIIGLAGKARSGKNTVAQHLARRFGYQEIAFADPLKAAAGEIFGLNDAQLYGADKERVDAFWGETPRAILQKLGTDCLRNGYASDVWVRALQRRISFVPEEVRSVVTDVRFPNEAVALRAWGGEIWQLVRLEGPGAQGGVEGHISENAMDDYPQLFHVTISASSGVAGLLALVDEALMAHYGV